METIAKIPGVVFFGVLLLIYFIPTAIAFIRHAKGRLGVLVLNIFTAWTFFGWVGALVWAVTSKKEGEE